MNQYVKKQRTEEKTPQTDEKLIGAVTAAVLKALSTQEDEAQNQYVRVQRYKDQPKTIDLIGLVFAIFEKFWLVIIMSVLFAVLLGARAQKSVPTYTATAKLYIVNPNNATVSFADLQMGTALTMDYQEVFRTWEVHEMVREELDLPYSYEAMQGMITVTNPEDTRLLYISATHTDAQTAADIANAYAKAAKEFIITTMHGEEPSDFSLALVPSYARIVSKTNNVTMGFMLGGVLAVGILTLLYILDERPRTPDDISNYAGIPTLAVLPSSKERRRHAAMEHRETARQGKDGGRSIWK